MKLEKKFIRLTEHYSQEADLWQSEWCSINQRKSIFMGMPSETDKWGWQHVSVFGEFDKGSGTKRWKCNHCNQRYNGSYSRVRAHLLGFTGVGVKSCPAIDKSLREEFRRLEEERLQRKKKKNPFSTKIGKKIKNYQMNFSSPARALAKEDVDETIARFFFADGLDMNIVNSSYFKEMIKAVATFGPGYEPPSKDMLSDCFLSKEKAKLEKAITLIRESWPHTGCTIICVNRVDGSLGCFCINLFISSPRGVLFLKSIDINEGVAADSLFINVLNDAIIEVGPANVLQIITHLGQASVPFESVISSKFPHIFWSHCTSHSIHLLMEEIAGLDWMKAVVLCARGIEQVILSYRQSSFFKFDPKESSNPLFMRFALSYCLVQKILLMKLPLQELVTSNEWKQWKLTAHDDVVSIEATVLGDEFWASAQLMLQLCEPFVRLLATLNIDKSVMGDVYNWRVQSLEAVRSKGIDDIALSQIELLIDGRWDALFSPLHAAGYMLNPRYFGRGQSRDKTVMRGWKATLEKYEHGSSARRLLREQLSTYWRPEGSFAEEDAVECRDKMDPVAWWENFGFETPHLQTLAIKVLSQNARGHSDIGSEELVPGQCILVSLDEYTHHWLKMLIVGCNFMKLAK
ncbi:hypothetical protein Cgig2_016531 [Carnegiea gigantea]|uniref:DUF659 domain-containing protein n=1 Tax=Carnegiea gigantea TaxID=171969 RepID=A0A9Q1JY70_9CARY|nr:hypothetical protein Cgig2_016531 [Carnegiea gigantea]